MNIIENHGMLGLLELDENNFITKLEKKLHDTYGKFHVSLITRYNPGHMQI